jgi:4-hydroxybenzoate polyprenyltransferase/predicted HAD superfamily phosphohydrolase YqeG
MFRFEDLDSERFLGAALIVDVDGTLTHDAGDAVAPERAAALERLRASAASVTLVSNGSRERTRLLAEAHGVDFLDTRHRKPSRRVLETFSAAGSPVYMLGDKVLTDGLFAANIGARFVPVSRIRHENDMRATRATYLLDDLTRPVMRLLMPVLPAVTLMRPTQWIKNLLVFAPIFFAGDLRPGQLALAAAAFAIFSLAASVVYIVNDLSDRATDRLHPSKRFRALASGAVGERSALALAIMLGALVAAGLLFVPALAWVVGAYLVGNALYSRGLKRVAVVDVSLVALFYVLRVVAGGVATATFVSPWIILCVFFGALFLALGKRRTEYISATKRTVREMYTRESIDLFVGLSAVLAIISYGIYSVLGAHSPLAVYSTVLVFAAIARVCNGIFRTDGDAEYPESLVFRDRWALALTALWAAFMLWLLFR